MGRSVRRAILLTGMVATMDVAVRASSLRQAPDPVLLPAVAFTGRELLVWGGTLEAQPGMRYDVATATWTPMSTRAAPTPRLRAASAWTGALLLV